MGSKDFNDLVIKSNSQERMRFTADGTIITNEYLLVNDSMRVKGPLFVGDSSIALYDNVPWNGVISSHIVTEKPRLCFGYNANFAPQTFFSQISVGIGTHNPLYKLHLHDYMAIANHQPRSVLLSFTNSGGTGDGTGDHPCLCR